MSRQISRWGIPSLLVVLLIASMLLVIPTYAQVLEVTTVENKDTGGTYNIPQQVPEGSYGDTIIVEGSGVIAGKTVELYWDLVQAWDGEAGLLNSTKADAAGEYEIWFKVPEAVSSQQKKHYIWIRDVEANKYVMVEFTVKPVIKLSSSSGLPDDTITVNGYGFGDEVDVTVTFDGTYYFVLATKVETNDLGSFSTSFKVPDVPLGEYTITATDNADPSNQATADFIVGPSITITPEEGPSGTVVTVKGRGFRGYGVEKTKITKDDVALYGADQLVANCYVVDEEVSVRSDGTFTAKVVIPCPQKTGDYELRVYYDSGYAAADFEVTGRAEIETEKDYGSPGDTMVIHGYNFTQISGEDVVLRLYDEKGTNLVMDEVATFETDSNGEFSGTFTIPAVSSGTYTLKAVQDAYEIEASTPFRIGLILVLASPTKGETGTKVVLTGTGFEYGYHWNATFGDIVIFDHEAVEEGGSLGTEYFYVPTVDPGVYTITVTEEETGIEVTTEFTVTATTTVVLDPDVVASGFNVTIKGWNFADKADNTLTCVIYNETNSWDMDVWQGSGKEGKKPKTAAVTDKDGNFTAWWNFNDGDIVLDPGVYTINITDTEDLFAQVTLTIVEETVEIAPRKAEYNIGDTVAFDIKCSFMKYDPETGKGSYIEIYDPDGNLFWKTDEFVESRWLRVDAYYTVPYYSQTAGGNPMILPPDAPTGTWTWIFYDYDGDQLANGTFTVLPAVEALLEERITSLEESVQSLSEDVAGLKEDISGVKSDVADLKSDVAAAAKAAQEASKAVSELSEAVSEVAETANTAAAAAQEAKSAAEEAKTAASGLTPLIYGAIGVSLIAALAAIVSLIQISRRIAG